MENKEKELKKQNKGRGWIYNKVPRNTLVLLSKSPLTITEISKETDSQYSSVLKVIKMLEENGLIQTEKRGRIRIVWLTEFGEKISNLFKRIDNMIEKAWKMMDRDIAKARIEEIARDVERILNLPKKEEKHLVKSIVNKLENLKNMVLEEQE